MWILGLPIALWGIVSGTSGFVRPVYVLEVFITTVSHSLGVNSAYLETILGSVL